jgi:hypothetical protein
MFCVTQCVMWYVWHGSTLACLPQVAPILFIPLIPTDKQVGSARTAVLPYHIVLAF